MHFVDDRTYVGMPGEQATVATQQDGGALSATLDDAPVENNLSFPLGADGRERVLVLTLVGPQGASCTVRISTVDGSTIWIGWSVVPRCPRRCTITTSGLRPRQPSRLRPRRPWWCLRPFPPLRPDRGWSGRRAPRGAGTLRPVLPSPCDRRRRPRKEDAEEVRRTARFAQAGVGSRTRCDAEEGAAAATRKAGPKSAKASAQEGKEGGGLRAPRGNGARALESRSQEMTRMVSALPIALGARRAAGVDVRAGADAGGRRQGRGGGGRRRRLATATETVRVRRRVGQRRIRRDRRSFS